MDVIYLDKVIKQVKDWKKKKRERAIIMILRENSLVHVTNVILLYICKILCTHLLYTYSHSALDTVLMRIFECGCRKYRKKKREKMNF